MSERKEKKIRRLQRRIEELEGENMMLRTMFREDGKHYPYLRISQAGKKSEWVYPDGTAAPGFCDNPLDAHYAPIPSGHKPGIFRRLKAWLFG